MPQILSLTLDWHN